MITKPIEAYVRVAGAFRSSSATHSGMRPENQDSCVNRPDLGVWAVADGAGGHSGGGEAARSVTAALDAIPVGLTSAELLAQIRLRLSGVHAALRVEASTQDEDAIMATTVVVLIARGRHFACLWVGDSRAYRLTGGSPVQITRDHSVVQELIDEGTMGIGAAAAHPQANVITRAIGAGGAQPGLDKVIGQTIPGDVFLLCTDGVWKTLDVQRLAMALESNSFQESAAVRIVEAVLANDASDNATAVVVAVAAG